MRHITIILLGFFLWSLKTDLEAVPIHAASARRPAAASRPAPVIPSNVWMNLPSGTRVYRPSEYPLAAPAKVSFDAGPYKVVVYARSFSQGNSAYLEVIRENRPASANVHFTYQDLNVPLTTTGWGYRGFFPLAPEGNAGVKHIKLFSTDAGDFTFTFSVASTDFPTYTNVLALGNYSNQDEQRQREIQEFIAKCQHKKEQVFSRVNADTLSTNFAHPRNRHSITSPFFTKRVLEQFRVVSGRRVYLPPQTNYHRGLDLYGMVGEPIYAMADGKVVIAERMHFEGNFTVVDHGNGIFTGYMHQSRILVTEGQIVHASDKIGEVGSTGMATGPHLHVSLWIRGIAVDPLSLLGLPVRN